MAECKYCESSIERVAIVHHLLREMTEPRVKYFEKDFLYYCSKCNHWFFKIDPDIEYIRCESLDK